MSIVHILRLSHHCGIQWRLATTNLLSRSRYTDCIINVDDLISKSTHDLFNKMCIPSHCLHHLLPDHRVSDNLRLRGHGFQLPTHCTVLHKNSFVTRSLFLCVSFLMCVCLIIFNKRLFRSEYSFKICT